MNTDALSCSPPKGHTSFKRRYKKKKKKKKEDWTTMMVFQKVALSAGGCGALVPPLSVWHPSLKYKNWGQDWPLHPDPFQNRSLALCTATSSKVFLTAGYIQKSYKLWSIVLKQFCFLKKLGREEFTRFANHTSCCISHTAGPNKKENEHDSWMNNGNKRNKSS